MASKKKGPNYDASSIKVLEGLDAVRKRPAMYIGSTDEKGLHHIFVEVLDNVIDEAIAGYCDTAWITIKEDGSLSVKDNGRGIPIDTHKSGKSALEVVMTNLHAGGKFDNKAYQVSGGLHGVGIKCTNALSSWMVTKVFKDGKVYEQEYKRGIPQTGVEPSGETDFTGTEHIFKPDEEIFSVTDFNYNRILKRCRENAFLVPGLTFFLVDERKDQQQSHSFYFENGIKTYVRAYNAGKKKLMHPIYIKEEEENVIIEVALQHTEESNTELISFTNNILNIEGGTHESGFKAALTSAVNSYAKDNNLLSKLKGALSGDDVREGLTAIISVKVPEPQFEGQTKLKLNNPEVKSIVYSSVREKLLEFFEEHPSEAKGLINKAVMAKKARVAAKKARKAIQRKGALSSTSLPGKLADCSSKDPEESEIYIVEGDSAGGSAKQGRDRMTQAIFPLRGKPLNAEKSHLASVLKNKEFANLVKALGAGVGEEMDLDNLRYHKVIIMTDADVDGAHIITLTMTFLFRYMPELIKQGYVYIAQPPLFKIVDGSKNVYWVQTEEEKEAIKARILKDGHKVSNVQRFKGLGEMNPKQLWHTTMDPENRILRRVTIEDAEESNIIFNTLMGSEVPPRRRFIMEHAKFADVDMD
jgi:DNA gyrase subunit B